MIDVVKAQGLLDKGLSQHEVRKRMKCGMRSLRKLIVSGSLRVRSLSASMKLASPRISLIMKKFYSYPERREQLSRNGFNHSARKNGPRRQVRCAGCPTIFSVTPSSTKKFCSQTCAYARPGQGGYRENSTRKTRHWYKGFYLHSRAELKMAKILDSSGVAWVKNSTTHFLYVSADGRTRKYFPDFYLPAYDWWVEVKSKFYETPDDRLKILSVPRIELQYHDELHLPTIIGSESEVVKELACHARN